MRRDFSRANRAITLGDRSDWQVEQELLWKKERHQSVQTFKAPHADTRIYCASHYLLATHSLIWASVISTESQIHPLLGIEEHIDDLENPSLLAAVSTLAALTNESDITFFCDDPELPNPLEHKTPPAAFGEVERMLWDILLELTAERDLWNWYGVHPCLVPRLMELAQNLVEEQVVIFDAEVVA